MTEIVKNKGKAAAPAAKEPVKGKKAEPAPAPAEEEVQVVTYGKADIAEGVAEYVKSKDKGCPPSIAQLCVEGLEHFITEALNEGNEVRLGIGKFAVAYVEEREGRNPQTGEAVTIPARWVPKFKASAALKAAVNEGDSADDGDGDGDGDD